MLRVSIVVLAALLLAGCSGDEPGDGGDGSSDAGPDRAVVERSLAELYAGDHATARDDASGACFAEELVDRAGIDRLRDVGIVAASGEVAELPEFDEETARLWVDAQFACVDYVEESTRALAAQSKGRIDQETYAACLRDALTDDELRAAVVATLSGDWEAGAVTALSKAQADCSAASQPAE